LGVDKDGQEWYQVSLGGSDGSTMSGPATAGRILGPAFAASEVVDVIESVLLTYREQRQAQERLIDTLRRVGMGPFKAAANEVRGSMTSGQLAL
jgi:sulfite reductase (NADPH) hemoprotein beta-component